MLYLISSLIKVLHVTALKTHRPRGPRVTALKGMGQTCHSKATTLLTFVTVEAPSLTLNIKHNYKYHVLYDKKAIEKLEPPVIIAILSCRVSRFNDFQLAAASATHY